MIDLISELGLNTPVPIAWLVGLLMYPIILGGCREIGSLYFLIKNNLFDTTEEDTNT